MPKSSLQPHQIRILIADDFSQWRVQVRKILQSRPELHVIAEASDGLETIRKTAELRPDIVLLDIGMPILNGIEAAKRIRQACPGSKIIFLTQDNDADTRRAALGIGAEGYVLKLAAARELVSTIEAALGLKPQPEVPYPAGISRSSSQ